MALSCAVWYANEMESLRDRHHTLLESVATTRAELRHTSGDNSERDVDIRISALEVRAMSFLDDLDISVRYRRVSGLLFVLGLAISGVGFLRWHKAELAEARHHSPAG